MKTILWATLTANGNYARSSADHPPKPEAFQDFIFQAQAAGNFIVGRRTFEGFRSGGGEQAFTGVDIAVVSGSGAEIPGVTCVASPKAALEYLKQKGHKTALLTGGETLHNAFLAENLVDELVFNIAPVLEDKGLNLLLANGQYKSVQLLESKDIGGGVIQLHYAVHR